MTATPIRRQYLSVKHQYPDVIVFFRLGDFYETFDDDARVASSALDITLTSREMGRGNRVPMAGIPYHAAEGYISRLIAAGHKVAICEQIGQPNGRDLVERRVTRVVTPGTLTEPSMLDGSQNRYIVSILVEADRAGLAAADLTTGEFATTEINTASAEETLGVLRRELLRIAPVEVTVSEHDNERGPASLDQLDALLADQYVSRVERRAWRLDRATDELQHHFSVDSLEAFGCSGKPFAIRAAGALLHYLQFTQLASIRQITELVTYSTDRFMPLDAQTRRNLELIESSRGDRRHSLVAVLDQTRTPMGSRLLRRWIGQPLLELDPLRERLDAVEFFFERALARARMREGLSKVTDLERLLNRVTTGSAGPRELQSLGRSLGQLPSIQAALGDVEVPGDAGKVPDCSEIVSLISRALVDEPPAVLGGGPTIRRDFNDELDRLRSSAHGSREWIANLEQVERERTGIRSLKVGYNKVFGYYLEISHANAGSVPDHYLRKQTLVGAERYITPELKEYESQVLNADEQIADLESAVYRQLLGQIAGMEQRIREAATMIARLDALSSLAEVAVRRNYVRPDIDDGTTLEIVGGRHPIVEIALEGGSFVPNDTLLDTSERQIALLTGPNMAGKSTYLRQVALIVLMAQIGSFVPAERAAIGLVDRIFTRIGAQDDIASGQSTFMIEMVETASILHHATSRSLVVLDEIGRGTSTYDGLAIARATVEQLHNSSRLGCKTLFATHYHELTSLERLFPRIQTYRVDVLEEGEDVVFLHRVVPGGADRSYGIYVARLAGMPRPVVRRAQEILDELESSSAGQVERSNRKRSMGTAIPTSIQLQLFGAVDPVVEELKSLDVESLTPLDALNFLYELQRKLAANDDQR